MKKSYFYRSARRYVISKYGEKALQEEGLRVWTTVDKDLQDKAEGSGLAGSDCLGNSGTVEPRPGKEA